MAGRLPASFDKKLMVSAQKRSPPDMTIVRLGVLALHDPAPFFRTVVSLIRHTSYESEDSNLKRRR